MLPYPCLLQRPGSPLCVLLGERQLLAVLPDAQVQRLHMLGRPPLLHLQQQPPPNGLTALAALHASVQGPHACQTQWVACNSSALIALTVTIPRPSLMASLHGSRQILATRAAVWVQYLHVLLQEPLG